MISHKLRYAAPQSIEAAAHLMSDTDQLVVAIGGGTMLVPRMTRGEERPGLAIDLRNLGLKSIDAIGDEITIGARVTYDDIMESDLIRNELPLLKVMADGVTGGRSITGQGTLGGSACFANPASDVPACLAALDAKIRLVSVSGTREVASSEFFVGAFSTARRADEIAVAIVVPRPRSRTHVSYRKVKPAGSSWPILTVACVLVETGSGFLHARCSVGGLAPRPVSGSGIVMGGDTSDVDRMLAGLTSPPQDAWEDALGDREYRAMAAPPVARRVFREAMEAYDAR